MPQNKEKVNPIMNIDKKEYSVHVLASGSKGNATLVKYGDEGVLFDAGISGKRLVEGLNEVGVRPEKLQGICLTHEHSDHIAGVVQMMKRFAVPVYTKEKTWRMMQDKVQGYEHCFCPITKKSFVIGNFNIEAFPIYHDAIDPIGFSCYAGEDKMTIVTDTGYIDDEIMGNMEDSNLLVLESNHDLEMLKYGPYVMSLKRRVAGPYGHLDNTAAARAILAMKNKEDLQVVLAHRSEQNNDVNIINKTMSLILGNEGLRIGKDISLFHGQPKQIVSLYSKKGNA